MKSILPLLLSVLFAASGIYTSETPAVKPSTIVILSNNLGYADLGVHGSKDIPQPRIDRIATRGVRFTHAYSSGAFCTPTRAAL
jgi:arylsulfatase A-like enzyme